MSARRPTTTGTAIGCGRPGGEILQFRESVTTERGMGEEDVGQYDKVQEVDYINGCAPCWSSVHVIERVGLFDPIYYGSASRTRTGACG